MDGLRAKMSALTPFAKKHKVTVIGSGNWGSTIGKMVAENTAEHPELFERDVQMWVYEEQVEVDKKSKIYDESHELCRGPQKLTEIINTFHENVKYLPDIALPHNLVANPSLTDAVKNSSILIFNLPHQFIINLCKQMRGHILPFARGISCIKGVNVKESSISLFSETIGEELGIYCGALSGANIAKEIAAENFSETTIAYDPPLVDSQAPTPATSQGPSPASSHVDLSKLAHLDASGKPSKVKLKPLPAEYHPIEKDTIKKLFHRRYFHVRVVSDVAGVSLGGALKNVIAVAAGWVDGLGWGDNAKAAVMRVGLLEMREFGNRFFPHTVHPDTFTVESAGVADLITTCSGGRNHRCAKLSIMEGKSIEEIEARELNGQKLQGAMTAHEVHTFLKSQNAEKDFPLMTAVHNILMGTEKAENIPDLIEPEDEDRSTNNTIVDPVSNKEDIPLQSRASRAVHPLSTSTSSIPPSAHNADNNTTMSAIDHTTTQPQPQPQPQFTTHPSLIPAPPLASSRYNRQLLVPQFRLSGQDRLLSSRVLIIGLGGLGCPAALYLAGAGVGTLGLMDADTVELGNLHRQIAHTEAAARDGLPKVRSALDRCRAINSEVRYVTHETRATAETILGVVAGYDLVLDCTDNPATRYLISDACVVAGKILVSGAAQRGEGSLAVLNCPPAAVAATEGEKGEEKGPCYRCVFPRPPPPEMVRGCSEIGVLGPVVGVIGTLMAGEAIKIIARGEIDLGRVHPHPHPQPRDPSHQPRQNLTRQHTMLLYNTYAMDPRGMFRTITLRGRRKDCLACGDDEVLAAKRGAPSRITADTIALGRLDYQAFCGVVEDVKILDEGKRIDPRKFLDDTLLLGLERDRETKRASERRRRGGKRGAPAGGGGGGVVVDVREEHEFELGTKVRGSINIPISRILRMGANAFEELDSQSPMSETRTRAFTEGDDEDEDDEVVMGDGGMVNPESHIPVASGVSSTSTTTITSAVDGGMVNIESHIPITRDEESDFPPAPRRFAQTRSEELESEDDGEGEGEGEGENATPVYFVCQRGNDSQIAAQKMIEAIQREKEQETATETETETKKMGSKWGWIGDVHGGFMAMERIRP